MTHAATDIDTQCINTLRTLAMDAVQKANSGHPGTPMGLAPVGYTLWSRFLRYHPQHPDWPSRDRFVLSVGHASMLLYSLLHLAGVVEIDAHGKRSGQPACRAVSVDIQRGMGRVQRHIGLKQQAQYRVVVVQPVWQHGLEQQRVVAQNKLRALLKRRTHRGWRWVEAHGKFGNILPVRSHLKARNVPRSSGVQRRSFFYRLNNFNMLHRYHPP